MSRLSVAEEDSVDDTPAPAHLLNVTEKDTRRVLVSSHLCMKAPLLRGIAGFDADNKAIADIENRRKSCDPTVRLSVKS